VLGQWSAAVIAGRIGCCGCIAWYSCMSSFSVGAKGGSFVAEDELRHCCNIDERPAAGFQQGSVVL
jgi:hypothetical protein